MVFSLIDKPDRSKSENRDRFGYVKLFTTLFHDRIAAMPNVPTPDETMLGILAAEAQHGYQLLVHFNAESELGRVWSMSTSQVYAVLKRLEQQGLIAGRKVHSPDAPTRVEYSITPAGQQALEAWLYDPQPSPSIRRVRIEFISRLYVARLLGIPLTEIVQLQHKTCEQQRQRMLTTRSLTSSPVEQLVLDFVIGQLDAALAWIDSCEARLSMEKK